MTQGEFLALFQEMLQLILALSMPILMTSLGVGVAVSIVQAVTQIQEQTLTFVPKVLACIAVLILLAPWMVDMMVNHTAQQFALMMQVSKPGKKGAESLQEPVVLTPSPTDSIEPNPAPQASAP